MGKFQDLTGQRFGRLVAIKPIGKSKKGGAIWECKCDCGKISNVNCSNLKNGHTKSCGCNKHISKTKTHGMSKTRLYQTWGNMKRRCYDVSLKKFEIYGARGIIVCEEWKNDFKTFYDWAITNGYSKSLTLDRIDTNGNYEPNNCRWITIKEQCNNKRNNKFITYYGITLTQKQWADKLGINSCTFNNRIKNGIVGDKLFSSEDLRHYNHTKNTSPKKSDTKIEHNGEIKSITKLAKEYGINRATLFARIYRGMNIEKALQKGDLRNGKKRTN